MAGVFGVVATENADLIQRMADAMSLLEWTRSQSWTDSKAGVGLGQLNIGLFATDAQPLKSDDGNVSVVFFGELYYTETLRHQLRTEGHKLRSKSDTELILRLYQAWGDRFIKEIEGVFVLAIWDQHSRRLLVANDRFGLIPTYYAHYKGKLLFAPRVKAILVDPDFEKKLNLVGMAQFLRFQRLLGDITFFEGIHLLPYATLLEFDQRTGSLRLDHHWDFDRIQSWPKDASFDEAVVETGRLLHRAVEERVQGDYQIGVYLSGGLDSRVLLAFASQIKPPVPSLTYGVPDCRDAYYAERIARRVRSPHHFIPVPDGSWIPKEIPTHLEITEGFLTWTHSHAALTLRPARSIMDVNLTGIFGDLLLGGRAIDHSIKALNAVDDLDFACRMYHHLTSNHSWPGLIEGEAKMLFARDFYPRIRDLALHSLMDALAAMGISPKSRRIDSFFTIHQITRMSNMNAVFQRAFFEARYPFFDYALVDLVLSLPTDYRLGDRLYLAVINREVREVTWIPRDTDERLLTDRRLIRESHSILQRLRRRLTRKRRFSLHEDPENWLRNDLREWTEALLFDRCSLNRGFYNTAFLRTLFERHMSGDELHTVGKLAPIMTYEMMLRAFYD